MASLIRANTTPAPSRSRELLLLGICALALGAAFLLLPGDLAQKAHLVLHGICAQRPSHSLRLGSDVLPLDARMSGIYLGAAVCGAWLMATGRLRTTGRVSRSVVAVLALFVAVMAIDGTNALLVDLNLPHLYEPSNFARMTTGIFAGVALGAALGHLFSISMWATPDRQRSLISRPRELTLPILASGALGGLALSGLPILFAPFAVGLIGAALAVFWELSMVLLALSTGRAWRHGRVSEMAGLSVAALVAAAGTLAVLSAGRLAAELYLGLPRLT